jgi:hypothetical protein
MRRRLRASLICALSLVGINLISSVAGAAESQHENATISFGQWLTDPPLDRLLIPVPPAGTGNHHELIPNDSTVVTSGIDVAVNFIIAGLHNVQVYDAGTQPGDINADLVLTGGRAGGGIIDDPNKRIYRGLDPNLPENPRDRVEVVRFDKPGTYLVICGVRNHFVNDAMFGFVTVVSPPETK